MAQINPSTLEQCGMWLHFQIISFWNLIVWFCQKSDYTFKNTLENFTMWIFNSCDSILYIHFRLEQCVIWLSNFVRTLLNVTMQICICYYPYKKYNHTRTGITVTLWDPIPVWSIPILVNIGLRTGMFLVYILVWPLYLENEYASK